MEIRNDPSAEQPDSGNWRPFVMRIKSTWTQLRDEDLDVYEGRIAKLERHIAREIEIPKQTVRRKIELIAREARYSV